MRDFDHTFNLYTNLVYYIEPKLFGHGLLKAVLKKFRSICIQEIMDFII